MNDKVFYIVIAFYCVGFGMLGAQFFADSYGITLRAPDGTPIKSAIVDYVSVTSINNMTAAVQSINNGTSIIDAIVTAAYVGYQLGWDLFTLLFGFYIFNIMYLFGIPVIYIIPIAVVYVVFLVITIIAKVRGV